MIFLLAELPHGIANPVHIFDWRYNQEVRNWILLPILLITLYWLYRYFKNMQKEIIKRKPKVQVMSPNLLREKIEYIEKNFSSNFQYREGLHELSAIMKSFYESKYNLEIEEMTADEILRRIKDKKVGDFFLRLSILQFGKNPPLKTEFDEIFIEAKSTSGISENTSKKRKNKSSSVVRPER